MIEIIAHRLQIGIEQVKGTVKLLEEGATVPFISRYRKEVTGSLDEVAVGSIKELYEDLTELQSRKSTILNSIESSGNLTPDLEERIVNCWDSATLEDIYLPYKPKRRTKATVARERGLEPLANIIMAQNSPNLERSASRFVVGDVASVDEAISGACDIVAERVSEDERTRNRVRKLFRRDGILRTKVVKGKEEEGVNFSDYFNADATVRGVTSHRFLAMQRGVEEGILKLTAEVDSDVAIEQIERMFIRNGSATKEYMQGAIKDSYKRLLRPSIEGETISDVKERADNEAIAIFANNLRELLLAAPLGQKRVIAIDPGYRTGCKVVVLDSQGNLLEHSVIYPHPPVSKLSEASLIITSLVKKYGIEAFAIGDGTAGRETECFIKSLKFEGVDIYMVNEDGASVYSASPVAREEFPDHDVTVRGAVSIGRRLIDPLSELVKIEPKSIGVGQYQHSVDQGKLKAKLGSVVESCVNMVGVNLNTASKHILTYISGLGPVLAKNIVDYRATNGDFKSRKELLKVPRLGAKAFEQAAGFLRIIGGSNPLDNSAVHPEAYEVVKRMAASLNVTVNQFLNDKKLRDKIILERFVDSSFGLPTLNYIMEALDKRGLDPREQLTAFSFADIHTIEDLSEGMVVPGIVTNITAFGAFVDIGIKQDGLVHISQITDRYISSPSEVLHLGERVMVKVIGVDFVRKRISLSLRGAKA